MRRVEEGGNVELVSEAELETHWNRKRLLENGVKNVCKIEKM